MNFSGNNNSSSGRDNRWRANRSSNQNKGAVGGGSFMRIFKGWGKDADNSLTQGTDNLLKFQVKYFAINDLVKKTKFSRDEIRSIYRDFKQKCPTGILTESKLVEIYSYYFLCGDCALFSKHLFSALVQQQGSRFEPEVSEINFEQFLQTLSILMRGTPEEKIRWMFYFYDLNRDGMVCREEVSSMIMGIYNLMGLSVNPPIDEDIKRQHLEAVIEKLELEPGESLSYERFYQWFCEEKLIKSEMNF